jgi:iron complex outermembrane receptor protein
MTARRISSQALVNPALAIRNLPGVDVTQQGVDHYQITLRGRNEAFSTETYFMKDFRNLAVPGQGFIALGRTSLNDLDLERIEIVRGPGSALYGPGVEAGVVHFISKSASDYQGTSFSVGTGTQSNISLAVRHAQKINDKWAFKLLGKYDSADDFVLDPNDPTDAESLAAFAPVVISALTGEVLKDTNPLEDKITSYSFSGEVEYSYDPNTTIYLNGGYNYRRGVVRADLGEALQDYGNYFAQIRLTSDRIFAQFYLNGISDVNEKSLLYRTGFTNISSNQSYQAQFQYDWPIIEDKWEVNLGTELQFLRSDTKGTVHGRFEDDDNNDIFSGYVQSSYQLSKNLDFLVAARLDRFSAIDETTISPRTGLIYNFAPNQSVRLTFNRSVSSPSALFIFGDIPFGSTPAFNIQFMGGIQPIMFSDPLVTESFIPGVGSYTGTGIPLSIPYSLSASILSESFPAAFIDYLNSKVPEINGVSDGLLTINGNPISVLPERDKIRTTKTNAFEVGYKGIFDNKFSLGLDIYYNLKRDLIFSAPATPLVVYPTLAADLVSVVNAVTTDEELAEYGLDQATLGGIIGDIANGLAANPLGLVPAEVQFNGPLPTFIVTPSNTGEVDYFGADLFVQYYFNNRLSAYANYSWLNQNFFTDEEIGLPGSGQVYALNTPENRIRIGFDHLPLEKGWIYGLSLRYQDAMQVQSGTIYAGRLDAYTIVDGTLGYDFGNGFRLNMTGQNLLNNEYRVMPRMPKIGRFIMLKATITL